MAKGYNSGRSKITWPKASMLRGQFCLFLRFLEELPNFPDFVQILEILRAQTMPQTYARMREPDHCRQSESIAERDAD